MFQSYAEKLRDPRWQRRRLEVLSRAEFSCERCNATDKTLNVHHKLYKKGHAPWEYGDDELAVLCEPCHKVHHELDTLLKETLALLDEEDLERVRGYALGLACWDKFAKEGVDARISFASKIATEGAGAALGMSREKSISALHGKCIPTSEYLRVGLS
jgi:hypothetical protein